MKRGTTQGKAQAPGRSLDPIVRHEVPNSEGFWRRRGRREWCRVFRDTIPISRLFAGQLVIEFKPLNMWRVADLPSGMRGGWVRKPNPNFQAGGTL